VDRVHYGFPARGCVRALIEQPVRLVGPNLAVLQVFTWLLPGQVGGSPGAATLMQQSQVVELGVTLGIRAAGDGRR
jgi:hypothetical protein